MAKLELKTTDNQLGVVLAVLSEWDKDPKLCGLIEVGSTVRIAGDAEHPIVLLKVSGGITYDLWKKFCEEIEMQIIFPGY